MAAVRGEVGGGRRGPRMPEHRETAAGKQVNGLQCRNRTVLVIVSGKVGGATFEESR